MGKNTSLLGGIQSFWNDHYYEIMFLVTVAILLYCFVISRKNPYPFIQKVHTVSFNDLQDIAYNEFLKGIDSTVNKGATWNGYGDNTDTLAGAGSGFVSKGEAECKVIMEKMTGKPFDRVRPSWLRNPVTNKNLELDLYNEELSLAVEYDGENHAKFIPHFHGTKEKFRHGQYRDAIKDMLCKKYHVYLIRVPHTVKDIPGYLRKEYAKYVKYKSDL
jgi:hypothetical protein